MNMKTFINALIMTGIVFVMTTSIFIIDHQPGKFKVVFLDVGQGDAIFIQTPEKYQILIDTGASSVITSELGSVMAPWDRSLDMIIITHPDMDHFGAMEDVLEHYVVDTIIDNGFYHDDEFSEYATLVKQEGSTYVRPHNGYRVALPGDVILTFISVPDFGQGSDKNDESIIVRVDYKKASFLFTGDASVDIEEMLVDEHPELLDIAILKLGHHGSKTSSSELFLQATTPQIAVISAGIGNRYGHPHPDVMQRASDLGIRTVCTCDDGRIMFVEKDEGLMLRR